MAASQVPGGIPFGKRLLDLALTLPGLVLISPLMALIALSIWLVEGRPVLFRQARPGYKGRIFTLYKFRTMRNLVDDQDRPLADARRISPLGRFLRTTSLD